ncbi:MAG: PEP-CTERM sorting domain-containing protein [Planctomycetota bacterium]
MSRSTLSVLAVVAFAGAAQAQFLSYDLPGTTDFDGWDNLTRDNPQVVAANQAGNPFPGFPGSSPWPEAIGSILTNGLGDPLDTAGDDDLTGDATFDKDSGFGYPAGVSIYSSPFGNGGSYSVEDATPIASIETVVFQIQIGAGSQGFFDPNNTPSLVVNGTTTVPLFSSGEIDSIFDPNGPFGPLVLNTFGFQWDLRGLGPISSLDVEFGTIGTSSTIWALQLDQGSEFAAVSVPAPGALALAGLSGLALVRRRR